MFQPPKIKRILSPPSIPPPVWAVNSPMTPSQVVLQATLNLTATSDLSCLEAVSASDTPVKPKTTVKASANAQHAPAAGSTSTTKETTFTTVQRKLCIHPNQPLVAYVAEPASTTVTNSIHQRIIVQNTLTRQVVWTRSWVEIAVLVLGESEPSKLGAAVQGLGAILTLEFYDPASIFWSGMQTWTTTSKANPNTLPLSTPISSIYGPWQVLVVQTTQRLLFMNLQSTSVRLLPERVPLSITQRAPVWWHLSGDSLSGAAPSSNVVPVNESWVLVGCIDGSFKCLDWRHSLVTGPESVHHTSSRPLVIKSIKGLGKGDWIVRVIPANPYRIAHEVTSNNPTMSSSSSGGNTSNGNEPRRRRIITVTKRGMAYLIELDVTDTSLDIRPPLARFVGGLVESLSTGAPDAQGSSSSKSTSGFMEHALLSYDAHRDWVWWLTPPQAKTGYHQLFVWDLQALQTDLVQQSLGSKHMFKPDPTMTLNFFGDAVNIPMQVPWTVWPCMVHPSFLAESLVATVVTQQGDVYAMASPSAASMGSTARQATAAPFWAASLNSLLPTAEGGPSTDRSTRNVQGQTGVAPASANIKVHAVLAQSLGSSTDLLVATNFGIVVLEWPWSGDGQGARHWHVGSAAGSMGKSCLSFYSPASLKYGSLDVLKSQPMGYMPVKNFVSLYESPLPAQLPEVTKRRPFRMAARMLPSPSGVYLCVMWPSECRYEILHIPTLLQRMSQRATSTGGTGNMTGSTGQGTSASEVAQATGRNPVVYAGQDVADVGWVGDDDVFAVLHAPDLILSTIGWVMPLNKEVEHNIDLKHITNLSNLKDIRAYGKNVATLGVNVGVNLTKTATKAATSATKVGTKVATTATKAATTATKAVSTTAIKTTMAATNVATSSVTKVVKTANKGVKKSFGIFGGKSKKKDKHGEGTSMDFSGEGDGDDEESETPTVPSAASIQAAMAASAAMEAGDGSSSSDAAAVAAAAAAASLRRSVELRRLVPIDASAAELSSSIAAATCSGLGDVQIRGGNRNIPVALFGGPVLCIATRSEGDSDGHAYFYTRKRDEKDDRAAVYTTAGPMLPSPNLVEWDEVGHLCAIVTGNRVSVFLSESPEFVLLGTVLIPSPTDPDARVTSVKFIHGVLYCTTWSSVHCIFLGDIHSGICKMDAYCLSSTEYHAFRACQNGVSTPASSLQ
jgi:hypothetical protein